MPLHRSLVSQLGNVVFTHQGHCTRLGPSFPHLFHETHLTADFQLIEGIVQHTVTMKIDNPFVRCLDPAVILLRYQNKYPPMTRQLMI